MRKSLPVLVVAAAVLAPGAGQALARPAHAQAQTVTVVMKDPGCHWFSVGGKLLRSLSVSGPVSLMNLDEATLKVHVTGVGNVAYGNRFDRVGGRLALSRGVYTINMVGQKPDDNTLKLTVR